MARQQFDDMSEINPNTGLPKHLYDINHPQCVHPAIQGVFYMKKVKYATSRYRYNQSDRDDRLRAIDEAGQELHEIKLETGWYDWVKSGQRYKKVRKRSKNEYKNSLHQQDDRKLRPSMEDVGNGTGRIRKRHII